MKTAILSAIFAVISTAAFPQDPPKPIAGQPPSQPKPTDPPLSVLCAPGTTIQLGVAYNSSVVASGGTGAYQFAVTGGALPAGMALNPSSGAISGTPAADGTFSYTVQVTDSAGAMATTGSTPCTLQPPVAPPPAGAPAADSAAKLPAQGAPPNKPPEIGPPEIDPAKLAAPAAARDPQVLKALKGLAIDDHPYILGAEDVITIAVYNGPEFTGSHMIRPDGKITINFIGEVMALGFTPLELSENIKARLKKYIVDPDVSVSVTTINSKKFYIQGEINKPGTYPLLIPTRILEALVNAGGFRDFSNPKRIVIMHVDGERDKFNYKEVIAGKKMEQNIYVRPGDIILIK
jgi:polysaccharide export outer membrane protein